MPPPPPPTRLSSEARYQINVWLGSRSVPLPATLPSSSAVADEPLPCVIPVELQRRMANTLDVGALATRYGTTVRDIVHRIRVRGCVSLFEVIERELLHWPGMDDMSLMDLQTFFVDHALRKSLARHPVQRMNAERRTYAVTGLSFDVNCHFVFDSLAQMGRSDRGVRTAWL